MPSPGSARPHAGRQVNVFQALALLIAFVLMATLGGVLSAGLVMPAVATTSAVTDTSVRLFDDLPDQLKEVPLSEKSTIHAADGTLLATFYYQNRIVVPLTEISQPMQDAVVAIEDHRFWQHGGVDVTGMARAGFRNFANQSVEEGASTLTQQYVKNALIQAALTEKDPQVAADLIDAATEAKGTEGIARKLAEAKMAISLEKRISKEEILERYLNISQFGVGQIYGVEAAAQYFFSVAAKDLNYIQAATIAGITKAPGDYDPERNPEQSEARRNTVMREMHRYGYITKDELDAGLATPLADTLAIGQVQQGCQVANAVANAGYFCDYVTKIITNHEAFGETPGDRSLLLYRGGLRITTTLDPRLQAIADEEVKATIPVGDPSGVSHAISVIEPGTGKVLAMAQNRIYNPAENSAAGETAVNYNTDQAYGSSTGFSPGSTFKPFTLAQWLKEGHSLNEVIDARKMSYDMREFNSSCASFVGEYRFRNAEGNAGIMTVLDATRNSVNSGYMRMASEIDLCGIFETAKSLGVHLPSGADWDVLPANVIGSQEIAPLTMAAAFAGFASGGIYCEPIAITQVLDTDGKELPVPPQTCREALSPQVAAAMNHALGNVWNGTGRALGGLPGRPAAGKTGTTTHNEHTWFVGYTPQLSTAVWTGFAEGTIPVQRMTINGQWYRNVYGATLSGPTWKRFMTRAHEPLPVMGFAGVAERLLYGERRAVPDVRGMSMDQAEATLRERGFNVQRGGPLVSSYAVGSAAGTEPSRGSSLVAGTLVTLFPSGGEPAPPPPPPGGGGGGGGGDGDGRGRGGPGNPGPGN